MLPNASPTNISKTNQRQANNTSTRRYSLFNNNAHQSNSTLGSFFAATPDNQTANNEAARQQKNKDKPAVGRRFTSDMTGSVCQRCKRFEVDLTNASDDLSATDAELKASRQVISLLQRQLELIRIEKEGLEKLIISQANDPPQASSPRTPADLFLVDTSENITSKDLGDKQQMLLELIRTQLYAKDEEILKLKLNFKEAQNDKEQLKLQLHLLEDDNTKLKNEVSALGENLALRDQTIVSLSNEVFEQSNIGDFNSSQRRQSSAETLVGSNQATSIKAQRHLAKLIDSLDAYKKTNELLSNNVMNLTDRCAQAEKKEIETRSQCHELEAKCCQIQSKLLSLLKEIEQSSAKETTNGEGSSNQKEVIGSESVKLLIKRLLEDKSLDIPLSWKEGNRPNREKGEEAKSLGSKYECDELGFYIVTDKEEPAEKSLSNNPSNSPRNSGLPRWHSLNETPSSSSFSALPTVAEGTETNEQVEFNSNNKRNILRQISVDSTKSDEARWHIRWDNFIKDFDKVDLSKSKEFKSLLRSGVPLEYRCKVWKALVDLRTGKERERYGPDYYQSLLEPNRPRSASSKKSLNPSSKQIELDLLRTLPNNRHFETLDSSGTVRLRRVLTAYSEHNPKVGYCQGMNRLAAVALLVLPEEEAFWCLTTIIDNIMPTGYYNDLWLAQVDSSVVVDFMAIKMPSLSDHFKRNSIDLSLFAWFLTIFVDGTPPALFLRLWDSFLYEGDKILFRVALALLRMYEGQLLRLNNSVTVNNFLRSTVNAPMNLDQFFDIAFDWINPLSTRTLRTKRQQNLQLMRSGFEGATRSFVTPSPAGSFEDGQDSNKNDDSTYEDSSIISI